MKSALLTMLLTIPFFLKAQVIVTCAGNGTPGFSGDGHPATSAEIDDPFNIALDDSGALYICDYSNSRLRKVSPAYGGIITTIAGDGTAGYSGDNGPAIYAELNGVYDVGVDHSGNIYIADAGNNCIRKVSATHIITTIAGTGVAGYNGDTIPAVTAQLNSPTGIALDNNGNLYIADAYNYRIRKIDTTGIITTIAGTGIAGFTPDGGSGDTAKLNSMFCIRSYKGDLFFLDNHRIRQIDSVGIITTIAGNGIAGYSGDGGSAQAAEIAGGGIAIDGLGNLFLADGVNNRIREVDTNSIITTIAGTGMTGLGSDNIDPLLSRLDDPNGICLSSAGDVYIADGGNSRIRLITMHPLGINMPSKQLSDLQVFPNPSTGAFYINASSSSNEQVHIVITNVLNEKFDDFLIKANQQVYIELKAAPGLYFISATTAHQRFSEKIIIV